jgi:hypothetical protein
VRGIEGIEESLRRGEAGGGANGVDLGQQGALAGVTLLGNADDARAEIVAG